MRRQNFTKCFLLMLVVAVFSVTTSYRYKIETYNGINGSYKNSEGETNPYEYNVTLTFDDDRLHRIEKDLVGEVYIDKMYVRGSNTSDGSRTSYKESNGTEILVGIDAKYLYIDTKLTRGIFQNHIQWLRVRKY